MEPLQPLEKQNHISVAGMLYSVLFKYIKKKVDVRITETTIEIFYDHSRIASHMRRYGRKGQYSTILDHMPEDHQKYLEWNGDRFRKWAESIGSNTFEAVDALLTSKHVEQQTHRGCKGLLKLAEKFSPEWLEKACKLKKANILKVKTNSHTTNSALPEVPTTIGGKSR